LKKKDLDELTEQRDGKRKAYDELRKKRYVVSVLLITFLAAFLF
jgi:hypothetical protein